MILKHFIATSRVIAMPTRKGAASALLALGALAIGVFVYVLDRLPESAYFLPAGWSLAWGNHLWFGGLGGQLPAFVHVYAFALLTAAVFGFSRKLALVSCMTWFTADSLFELGQHPTVSPMIVAGLPAWFEGVPFLENTGPYFLYGTFDLLDLVAIAIGAGAAYWNIVILHIRHEDCRHVESS